MRFTPLAAFLAIVMTLPGTLSAAGWKAGVARAVITPTKPMWMAGYASRTKPAEGKRNDLWVKALALEDAAGKRVVLVTIDVCGIDRTFSNRVRDRLQQEYQLGRESVALSCSHTHSGPIVGGYLRAANLLDEAGQRVLRDYAAGLEDQIVATVGEAIRSLAPAELGWSLGKATFAVNRRENVENKVPELRAKGELKGPVDHDLPVMRVTSAADGKEIAIVFGYACHATTTALYEWSADWPGVACTNIERAHPGATAMSWIGCGGDQNPLPRRTYELLADYGKQAADAVEAALSSDHMKAIEPAALAATYGEIDLPFSTLPTREQIEADTKSPNKFVANRAKIVLAQLQREGKLSPHYPYPVEVWGLGDDVTWVLLGGEATVEYSLRIKRDLGRDGVWVAAYANDVMAYIPSAKVLREGRYEGAESMVYYALPTTWAPEIEELIVREVHRQVDETRRPK